MGKLFGRPVTPIYLESFLVGDAIPRISQTSWANKLLSVTRWLDYFLNFWPFPTMKVYRFDEMFAKVG